MNKYTLMAIASVLLTASFGVSATQTSKGVEVVPIGPAVIKVVEIGASAIKKD